MRFLILILLCYQITACTNKGDSDATKENQVKDIGIKFESFANNFNDKKTEYIISEKIDFEYVKGTPSAHYNYAFNPTTVLRIKIHPTNHNIQSFQLIKAVYGENEVDRLKSILSAPVLASLITQALNPTIPKEDIGPIIFGLFTKASENQNIEYEAVMNNVNYSAKFDSEFKSYLYTVEP